MNKSAQEILGNSSYPAISYGGYRELTRVIEPTKDQIKEDILILHAAGYRVIRTYDVHLSLAENVLKVIKDLKSLDDSFEMYVMLGAWITAANPNTENVIHDIEDKEFNSFEIEETARLARLYPDIVKIIAVGNEAMVHWASGYFVTPDIILRWVNYLQDLKKSGQLAKDLWITSSDNFAAWGGGDPVYHTKELISLINAVDYISMHTYSFHDSYYNPSFWNYSNKSITETAKAEELVLKAKNYSKSQFLSVRDYLESIGINKQVHIGETGWASNDNSFYGYEGTRAADEFKQYLYFNHMNDLCEELKISCFYFSAFDEPWKDPSSINGSENHFGLFTVDGKAKYLMWDKVDKGLFKGLKRGDSKIVKTYEGNKDILIETIKNPETF
ncbi:glycosyl hydrolase family 17 protein [Gammaproteobacteria bacterium]|jgi:exo-beta-1,3-glucanase (GH17 family)|nr:glycosyl hydrolase family 17 protein [Gammaproteobacteria bacterium]MDA7829980.1 glycosyl hydrolase family 17 protein [Gammaproteobacteria bacterium]MDA7845092.1 glycosyl hydrolase family 17 protein [Gammaproteobacteria bacterium]MDA9356283.1 glycosyl hydrolase family 17 protein [Gammaproteobacteria bacterium]MDC1189491.1 glycosyl hydrolase family 17 protein [Gammaproteobacteria bacterium]|tara:strand:+ start:493 stop:1653 length:1161 start_codon:yes stop_codon:yes gene_type:complete